MVAEQYPLLSLRMKHVKSEPLPSESVESLVETIGVLTTQEQLAYQCRDYLGRRLSRKRTEMMGKFNGLRVQDDSVDPLCREKMCEWSYRVCDHFQSNREIVAFAFSFLDRFIDRCSCDRTAFKLAAMTSLYMATKMLNAKQISVGSLAELSRGEFEEHHIAEMERVILETLDWRMNPPTVQAFIENIQAVLTGLDSSIEDPVYSKALFFAELCVYDYALVTKDRSTIAIASILNALEGVGSLQRSKALQDEFLAKIHATTAGVLHYQPLALAEIRSRLWYLYGCSEQVNHDEAVPMHFAREQMASVTREKGSSGISNSPTSVNVRRA